MNKKLKWILIIIGIILAGVVIYVIVKQALKEEAELSFPDSVVVTNVTDLRTEKISKAIAYHVLHLDTLEIFTLYMPRHFEVDDSELLAYIFKDPYTLHRYWIFMSRSLKQNDVKRVLAHEFIHVSQMESGNLIQTPSDQMMTIWKGDTIKYLEIEYKDRPQEIEAFYLEYKTIKELDKIWYK